MSALSLLLLLSLFNIFLGSVVLFKVPPGAPVWRRLVLLVV